MECWISAWGAIKVYPLQHTCFTLLCTCAKVVQFYCPSRTYPTIYYYTTLSFLAYCTCNRAWLVEGDFLRLFFVEERLSMTWFWIELLLWEMNFSFPFESLWGILLLGWRDQLAWWTATVFLLRVLLFFLWQGRNWFVHVHSIEGCYSTSSPV